MAQYFMIQNFPEDKRASFPQPSSLSFKKYHIVNKERTLDGTMVVDYVNSKEMIDVIWGVLTDEQFNLLQDLFSSNSESRDLRYTLRFIRSGKNDSGEQNIEEITAYTEEISYYPYFTDDGKVVWRNVSVSFVQE